jgi:hypothetical protein
MLALQERSGTTTSCLGPAWLARGGRRQSNHLNASGNDRSALACRLPRGGVYAGVGRARRASANQRVGMAPYSTLKGGGAVPTAVEHGELLARSVPSSAVVLLSGRGSTSDYR